MIKAYTDFWKNYFKFSGRTTRSYYWGAWLGNVIILLILGMVYSTSAGDKLQDVASWHFAGVGALTVVFYALYMIYTLATIIPWLSLQYRRFNDAGVPKWLYIVAPVAAVFTLVSYFTSAGWVLGIIGVTWLVIFVVSVLPTDDDEY